MEKEFESLEKIDNTLCLNWNNGYLEFALDVDNHCDISSHKEMIDCLDIISQALLELKAIKEAKPSEALELVYCLKDYLMNMMPYYDWLNDIEQYILKTQKLEKENEILREIIKSFFDKGSPLHQYIDNKFGLTIEVDNECSIMQLGKFKDVDLDKKLKEVLE